jgi:transposase
MRLLDPRGRVFVFNRPTDMRKGFAGLQALVQQSLGEDPLSGDLFVFVNRRKTSMKCLVWDRTGFVILYKHLEQGRFRLRNPAEKVELDSRRLELLLDGIEVGGFSLPE